MMLFKDKTYELIDKERNNIERRNAYPDEAKKVSFYKRRFLMGWVWAGNRKLTNNRGQ